MIDIRIEKVTDGDFLECDSLFCKRLPEYIEQYDCPIYGYRSRIKPGTVIANISFDSTEVPDIYCRNCIDEMYKYMRQKLDSRLWAFQ